MVIVMNVIMEGPNQSGRKVQGKNHIHIFLIVEVKTTTGSMVGPLLISFL